MRSRGGDVTVDNEYQRMRDVLEDYNHRQEFEHTLIDRKTTWMLQAQAILFAAYGLTFSGEETLRGSEAFRIVVGLVGAAVATLGWYGVRRLIKSKKLSWQEYKKFFSKSELPGPMKGKELQWGVQTDNTKKSLYPDRLLPLVFIVAWSTLVLIEVVNS
jgi:hypothetical protein